MKEKDARAIENCNLEQLFVMDELLDLEEGRGVDTAEVRGKIWEVVNDKLGEQNRYEGCTEEELRNLLSMAQRLEENDGISMTETIIKVEKVLWDKVDSGIVFEAQKKKQYPLRPEKEDAV